MSSVTITIQQIVNLCTFAGVAVDFDNSVFSGDDEQLGTELTIIQNAKVGNEDDDEVYEGIAACLTEYPEEGFCPLVFKSDTDA